MSTEPEIIFEKRGRAGIVTLNRPKALNALNANMVALMHPQLAAWADDASVELVIVKAAGEKAFCAGGDIRQLHDWGKAGDPAMRAFYHDEYRLNAFIKRYPKPYVALVDGIVMGGGVGLSVHGSHRVAGERLMFAMPETGIGFFPDVGGTFFLPRMPGKVGTWLGLTAARLGQADALWTGFATHAAPSASFEAILNALCEKGDPDTTLAAFSAAPAAEAAVPCLQPVIDRCFSGETVEEILSRLDAEAGDPAEWAGKQASIILTKSPTSLKIALRQMKEGAQAGFEDCMRIEYRIVSRVAQGVDFYEGVRAVIIDKDNAPKWTPAALPDVTEADIDAYFAPLEDELDLTGLDRG
ncbi:enoyl-CoA hydratase/isomerase family protein [Mesorhizobium microcysteis]|uniref:3-hydroxyisobutyryl-CoA hydrolase n=1 Tax=Neoaquamicrobium microcysteis TaxID=2682781 RepID=A0A5D4GVL6_9HYPH|nr:enoyl-CoA hydratase/isomerase family protein [Mesorhizobium microcysteis]TYR31953.1 enoyl-CoA hydratase/isomerase family protein [Mesorhizobium microcysteis]